MLEIQQLFGLIKYKNGNVINKNLGKKYRWTWETIREIRVVGKVLENF